VQERLPDDIKTPAFFYGKGLKTSCKGAKYVDYSPHQQGKTENYEV